MIWKTKPFERWGVIILFFLAGGVLFQASCTTLGSVFSQKKVAVTEGQDPKGLAFRSEDYIIYGLQGEETPATLAEAFLGDKTKAWMIEEENRDVSFQAGQFVVIPLKERNKGGLKPRGYQVVPILCYHTFSESCETPLCTSAKTFDQQMMYLKENHYRVISLKDLYGFLQYRHGLPERSIVITFDDGYSAIHDIAYPILNKYGFKGALFVYTDFVGRSKNAITWDGLMEMKADGFEIGSHGVSHSDLTKIKKGEDDKAYVARITKELQVSKKIIDQKLKQNTIYLAFPFGNYNQRVLHLSEQSGYKIGLSVKRGGNPFFADPLALRREQVINMGMKDFVSRLSTFKAFSYE